MNKQLSGIVVPLVTPLKENISVDEQGLEHLVEHVLGGNVDALFVLGTTGEGPCLSSQAKHAVIRLTNDYLRGRAKSLVGITDVSPEQSIKWSKIAADNGADAVVVAPPPYFPFTQKELVEYVRCIVRHSPLPVILYNIPRITKTAFEMESIMQLADENKVIGFKDSSRDLNYFLEVLQLIKTRSDWTVLTGAEELLIPSMEAGADGGVLGGANLFADVLSAFYQAIKNNNAAEIARMESVLADCRRIYAMGTGATSSIQVIKYLLERKGICSRKMSLPFKELDEAAGEIVWGIINSAFPKEKNI